MEKTPLSLKPLLELRNFKGRSSETISALVDSVIDTWLTVYGHKFMGKSSQEFDYVVARAGWAWAVRPFSEETIREAIKKWINPGSYATHDSSWPPTPHDFFALCKSYSDNWRQQTENPKKVGALVKMG